MRCAIHNYNHGQAHEKDKYAIFKDSLKNKDNILNYLPAGREIYVSDFENKGEPIMLTEFGGIAYKKDSKEFIHSSHTQMPLPPYLKYEWSFGLRHLDFIAAQVL